MKYLTKSKFKMALQCPTKLYYNQHPETYANAKLDDPFLAALAKGGFQVGELAKCYYPGGLDVKSLNYDESVAITENQMEKKNATIFEAAIRFENLFVRVDILEKKGKVLNMIEVKSKSVDLNTFEDELWDVRKLKKGEHSLKATWKDYIYDVAFQAYVLKQAYPDYEVNAYLMCADKSTLASVSGLNQKFFLTEVDGRTGVEIVGDVSKEALGDEILCKVDLNKPVAIIHREEEMSERFSGMGFEKAIWHFAKSLNEDKKLKGTPGAHCKGCEFKCEEDGLQSGFKECWGQAFSLSAEELEGPFVFDLWNWRGADKAIGSDKYLLEDLDASDITPSKTDSLGLKNSERQVLQVEKHKDGDHSPYLDLSGMALELSKIKYPVNMIDFETSMVAIPFNAGRRPYEQIAFQFSHHLIHEDGRVEHAHEFLHAEPGVFPNFIFVRELKKALEKNQGTIFRFSNHENTVLCQIHDQLEKSEEADKAVLQAFIETITTKKNKKNILWQGKRNMLDLCEWVKAFYYSPRTGGSNSIKYVLPAILNESSYLKEKYSKPVYGKDITSFGFKDHRWIYLDPKGEVKNPYNTLPPIFDQHSFEDLELLMSDSDIQNGGAAMTAYATMQFTQMSEIEREKVTQALLRYCELDTFAMVMIFEHWRNLIETTKEQAA